MVKAKYITEEYLDKKLQENQAEVIESIQRYILDSEERVMGELKNRRENEDTHQYSHIRINDELQDHDKRLKSLENS